MVDGGVGVAVVRVGHVLVGLGRVVLGEFADLEGNGVADSQYIYVGLSYLYEEHLQWLQQQVVGGVFAQSEETDWMCDHLI